MREVNKAVRKKDAMELLLGKPVYTDDIAPKDCLVVKLLRSPHANAIVKEINTDKAMLVPGIEAVYTWKDIDQNQKRFTCAGQTYPEMSPYDRLLLDRHVRFVGDPVAIIAGVNEKCVDRAMKLIKPEYEVLEPLLDFHQAKDNAILVHPEENWEALCPVGADNKRNLCAHDECQDGDVDAVLASCDVVLDRTYHTKACQQAMMETFRTFCSIDTYGRLHVVSSTQIVFHCRRIIAHALGIPTSKIRVAKPRIDGIVKAIDLHTLSNTGAYGEHGPTTVGLSGHKSIPLYGKAEAFRFVSDVVYTNHMSAGAYRGYGATQGLFAVESAVNELAEMLHMDPFVIREKNIIHEGDVMPAYYGQVNTSCTLDRCLAKVKEMIQWDEKYPMRKVGDHKVRVVGMAMQGSGISSVDVGSATMKVNDEGYYTLLIGAADMGTGCDTTLAQIAAEVLDCSVDDINVFGADTDISPYDSGSYASSTTYITGKAVENCALQLREKIEKLGADILGCKAEDVQFDGKKVCLADGSEGKSVSLADIATASQCGNEIELVASTTHSSPISPPPYMVGAAEIEVDLETGESHVVEYDACVDCGTPINTNLVRVQAEGGILQGIGMAMSENVTYNAQGRLYENSFLQYKIPSRMDIGHIRIAFENSYEEAGPFGAKSIGEVVINTPLPAIADALSHAAGKRFYELPITPDQVAKY